jgi:hypothetical protein
VLLKHLDNVLLARLRVNNRNVKGKNGHCDSSCLVFDYEDLIFFMDYTNQFFLHIAKFNNKKLINFIIKVNSY